MSLPSLDAAALDLLFRDARSHNRWSDAPVDDALLREAVELAQFGPTAMNTTPMRVVFVRSPEAKAKLAPSLAPGNLDKTMAAPATAIVAFDPAFFEQMPRLFPARPDAREVFAGKPHAEGVARMNATLQAAYLLIALRGLGLDVGPMTGFDAGVCDAAFFPAGEARAFMLMNIGHGDPAGLFPRLPRLPVDDVARIV